MFDGEGIEYFVMESVSARRRLPGNRAMEYLVKWKGYEKLHDTSLDNEERSSNSRGVEIIDRF